MGEYSRSLPGACHCWRQIKEHTPAIRMPLYWNKVSSHSAKGIRTDLKLPLDPAFAPFPKVDLCLIVFCHHINKFSRKDRMLMIGKRYKLSQEALILSVCWVSDLHCKISDLHSKIPLEKEIWKKVYFFGRLRNFKTVWPNETHKIPFIWGSLFPPKHFISEELQVICFYKLQQ